MRAYLWGASPRRKAYQAQVRAEPLGIGRLLLCRIAVTRRHSHMYIPQI
jgi:hypothetical protein